MSIQYANFYAPYMTFYQKLELSNIYVLSSTNICCCIKRADRTGQTCLRFVADIITFTVPYLIMTENHNQIERALR